MNKIKKCMKIIKCYLPWLVVGLILTEINVKAAYVERGYYAYGGEYLTLPLVLMLAEFVRMIVNFIKMFFEKEDEIDDLISQKK